MVLRERMEQRIHFLRGQWVMLSSDLAPLYSVPVRALAILRTFVHLRALLATHEDLRRKIEQMEKRDDAKCSAVFATLKQMREVPAPRKKEIGFHAKSSIQYPRWPSMAPHKTLQIKALFIHNRTSST